MGRLFGADEDNATGPSTVALISHDLWTTTYGSSPAGDRLRDSGQWRAGDGRLVSCRKGFTGFTVGADVWLPVRMTARIDPSPRWTARFNALNGTIIARARPGTSIDALRRQIAIAMPLINETVTDQAARGREARGAGVTSLREARRYPLVKPMLSLMGVGVVSLLLIVCANIASILLARGHARRGELGVRVALGALQWRVGRQVLTESTVLGALGLPAGILLGVTSASAIAALRPTLPQNWVLLRGTDLLAGASLSPNARVLTFATIVAGLATLLFGSGPALVASRVDAARLLTSGTDSHSTTPTHGRQVSRGRAGRPRYCTLLVVAGLMARSLGGLLHTDLGFRADGITAFQITSMDTSAAARVRRQELVARLEVEPGVEAVTMTPWRPFDLASAFLLGVRALDETDASARAQDVESAFRVGVLLPGIGHTAGLGLQTFTDADTDRRDPTCAVE